MRLRWTTLALMLAAGAVPASSQTAPFSLHISGPGTVAVGQPVRVRVILQNTSDRPIIVDPLNPDGSPLSGDGSVLSIKGPTGEELQRKKGHWYGSAIMGRIPFGVVEDDTLRIDSYYDLTQPGEYTLQLKRPIAEDRSDTDGFVSSNVIAVTISPEPVEAAAPLELTLTGLATFVSGSNVSLKVSAKNVSGQDFFLLTDPDGSVNDRYFHLKSIVGVNHAELSRFFAHEGKRTVHTISPGATLDVLLDRRALNFGAEWIEPTIYSFQLIYSATADWQNDLAESNVFSLNVTPAPSGGPTPFKLKLSGPATATAGDAVRIAFEETNTGGDDLAENGQVSPLEHDFSSLGYSLSVLGPLGRTLPLNARANVAPVAHTLKSMENGEPANASIVLSDFYDMSQPGAYQVQISRTPLAFTRADRVFSNVITINVTSEARR